MVGVCRSGGTFNLVVDCCIKEGGNEEGTGHRRKNHARGVVAWWHSSSLFASCLLCGEKRKKGILLDDKSYTLRTAAARLLHIEDV